MIRSPSPSIPSPPNNSSTSAPTNDSSNMPPIEYQRYLKDIFFILLYMLVLESIEQNEPPTNTICSLATCWEWSKDHHWNKIWIYLYALTMPINEIKHDEELQEMLLIILPLLN
jgi:hypothetical protein